MRAQTPSNTGDEDVSVAEEISDEESACETAAVAREAVAAAADADDGDDNDDGDRDEVVEVAQDADEPDSADAVAVAVDASPAKSPAPQKPQAPAAPEGMGLRPLSSGEIPTAATADGDDDDDSAEEIIALEDSAEGDIVPPQPAARPQPVGAGSGVAQMSGAVPAVATAPTSAAAAAQAAETLDEIVFLEDDGEIRKKLRQEVTMFGSRPGISVRLLDPDVSELHCAITRVPIGWILSDLNSDKGTLLNGRPVKAAVLKAGDIIQLGNYRFRFGK
jgi:hypothetical protein